MDERTLVAKANLHVSLVQFTSPQIYPHARFMVRNDLQQRMACVEITQAVPHLLCTF